MARRHFKYYEAVSSAFPEGGAFKAVIALKRRDRDEEPRILQVANQRLYALAGEADEAANAALNRVMEIDDEGELIWDEHAP